MHVRNSQRYNLKRYLTRSPPNNIANSFGNNFQNNFNETSERKFSRNFIEAKRSVAEPPYPPLLGQYRGL